MHIVYIALMILALIGMIVCSKKQKTNPAMQPVAFVLFVVVVISAGLLLNEMNVFGTRDGLLENEMKFYASQGTKTGDYLKTTFPGKKVLLVADRDSKRMTTSRSLPTPSRPVTAARW